jgi:hypothetical protein
MSVERERRKADSSMAIQVVESKEIKRTDVNQMINDT